MRPRARHVTPGAGPQTRAPEQFGARPPAPIDGYHAATDYPSLFHPKFAPAWTDATLARRGLAPPRAARAPFTLVDLGCGDGFFLTLLAAAHPEGRFIGIDAMSSHVEAGRRVAAELALPNLSFVCARFDMPVALAPGLADYVTAQGVLSWVGVDSRAAMWRLAARLLRPGGVLTLGYNCFPGWSAAAGLQKLLYGLCADPAGRIEAAIAAIRAGGIVDARVLDWFDDLWRRMPRGYFAHEFLNRDWTPFWSGDVVATAAAHGLSFAAQAHPVALRPEWTLRRSWRDTIAGIDAPDARETAFDLAVGASFRTDLFVKGAPQRIGDEDALQRCWAAPAAPGDAPLAIRTPAGRVTFDTAEARAILALLADGPARLDGVAADDASALQDAADALMLAGLIVPAEPPANVPAAAAVDALARARGLPARVGRHGVLSLAEGQAETAEARRRLGLG